MQVAAASGWTAEFGSILLVITTLLSTLSPILVAAALGAPTAPAQPSSEELEHRLRQAQAHQRSGEIVAALEDYDFLLELLPRDSRLLVARGEVRFRSGEISGALADFDRAVLLEPEGEPYLWQRGIAQYYAERYAECARQFEVHRTVNPDDVENAVWHFLCRNREADLETARRSLLPVGSDRRRPMREIYELFAGRVPAETVLEAARVAAEGPARQRAELYAYLYLGLYEEALGNSAACLKLLERAVALALPGYMADVARVHLALRR